MTMLQASALFLILPYLATAFYMPFPDLNDLKGINRRSLPCAGKSDKWLSFIPFATEQDPNFEFGIKTTWTIFYPKLLIMALQVDEFTLAGQPANGFCDWQKAKTVVSNDWLRTMRGDIFWKVKDSSTTSAMKTSSVKSDHSGNSAGHAISRSSPLPKNETLNHIAQILESNAPDADIYRWLCFFLGYWCLLGELLLIFIVVAYRHCHKRNVQCEADEYVEGIELDMLGANSLAKNTVIEHVDVEQDRQVVGQGSATAQEPRERFDPPPVYSLDGTGAEM